jgi:hypothetical protein
LSACERLSAAATLGLESPASQRAIWRLSCLFIVDAFAGGLVMQTYLVAWFARRWAWSDGPIGSLMSAANVVGGLSSALAGYAVARFGAVNTAVFTHLPSHALLVAVPLMPSGGAAAAMLVARFVCSQMDVPARQAYVTSVVLPAERSAAGGITNVVRSVGLALAPLLLGELAASDDEGLYSAPFFVAAALKVAYDLGLYALGTAAARADARAREEAARHAKAAAAAAPATATATATAGARDEPTDAPPKPAPPADADIEWDESAGLLGGDASEDAERGAAWHVGLTSDAGGDDSDAAAGDGESDGASVASSLISTREPGEMG